MLRYIWISLVWEISEWLILGVQFVHFITRTANVCKFLQREEVDVFSDLLTALHSYHFEVRTHILSL